ncbi:MAG: pre-peptidase C-terminal domain-containing protein, partial [Candidatus Cloacimonetes bacterium]|nr:pre-peptidase C-terminal domain-containing protein [Candidatus Cloacimonadota bacterium]
MKRNYVLGLILLMLCTFAFALTETEPNDTWDAAGVLMIANGLHDGAVTSGSDNQDYWKFESTTGDNLDINTCTATTLDTRLWLYDTDGTTQVAENDDDCGLQSRINYVTPADGVYYVEVAHYNHSGTGSYNLELIGASSPSLTSPDMASNPNPANGAVAQAITGTLTWDMTGTNTTHYDLWFGVAGSMVEVVPNAAAGATGSWGYTGVGSTVYEWQVITRNGATAETTAGPTWDFTTVFPSETLPYSQDFATWIPAGWSTSETNWQQSASNMAGGVAPEGMFMYSSDPVGIYRLIGPTVDTSGATNLVFEMMHYVSHYGTGYNLEIHTSSDGVTWHTLWSMAGASTPATLLSLPVNTGDEGSATFMFSLVLDGDPYQINNWNFDNVYLYDNVTPPPCATGPIPADGAIDQPVGGTLGWSASMGADGYYFYLGTSTGNYDIENGTVYTATAASYTDVPWGDSRYWKVEPYNTNGTATGCPEWSFTTTSNGCPGMPSPSDGAIDQPINGTLSWSSVSGATGYNLYFGTDGGGTATPTDILNGTFITSTSYAYSGLSYSTTHYWQVNALSGTDEATGCPIQGFTTGADPTISTFPHVEDFEGTFPPANWVQATSPEDQDNWYWDTTETYGPQYDHTSGSGHFARFDDSGSGQDNAIIYTNPFDVSALTAPTLEYWYWIGRSTYPPPANAQSTLHVQGWNGSTWDDLGTHGYTSAWVAGSADLTPYIGVTGFYLKFWAEGTTGYRSDIGIDDFRIFDNAVPPGCSSAPVAPTDGAIDQPVNGTIEWNSVTGATYYTVDMGSTPGGVDVIDGDVFTSTVASYSGLSGSSTYYWTVYPGNTFGDATGCTEWTFDTVPNYLMSSGINTTAGVGWEAGTATYTVTINNNGAASDTYDLLAAGTTWPAHFEDGAGATITTVTIPASGSTPVYGVVDVPAATGGTTDPVDFTVTSQGDPTLTDTYNCTTTSYGTAGGPDIFGYTYKNSGNATGPVYNWFDPVGGTPITGLADDNVVGPYPLGFSFDYYGTSYTDFYLNSNGTINFHGGYTSYGHGSPGMPHATNDPDIAWFWTDLNPNASSTEAVYYETAMVDGQNACVVTVVDYPEYNNGSR